MNLPRCLVIAGWLGLALGARADVLIGTDDERFVGTVIEETTDTVVFESELGGRLTVPRGKIREIQHSASAAVATNTVASAGTGWKPPGVGTDGYDWIQLKTHEWLRGWLKYVQDKQVEFDSDQFEEMTLKLKDIRTIYTAQPMYAKFDNREPLHGLVVLSNDVVYVEGPDAVQLPRDELIGITPSGGKSGINHWSGKFTVGLNIRSGNTESTDLSASAELARRTPATDLELIYLGNFAEVNSVQSENDQRFNATFDWRLDRHWFVRPVLVEYFHDPLANINYRVTGGLGVGYYIFDEDSLQWKILAGPGFQYTKFETVDTNQVDHSSTPVGVLYSYYKADLTRRIKLALTYQGMLTSEEAGLYNHHGVAEIEFEIKHHFDLDVSFVWDYLQNPQQEANGDIPNKSDLRLTLGMGLRF